MRFTNRSTTGSSFHQDGSPGMTTGDHYSIGQIARAFGVTHRAIRYYEERGLVRPARNGVARMFSFRDYERMRFIVEARRANLGIVDIQELLALQNPADGGRQQLLRRLQLLSSQHEEAVALCASLKSEIDQGMATLEALDARGSRAA